MGAGFHLSDLVTREIKENLKNSSSKEEAEEKCSAGCTALATSGSGYIPPAAVGGGFHLSEPDRNSRFGRENSFGRTDEATGGKRD